MTKLNSLLVAALIMFGNTAVAAVNSADPGVSRIKNQPCAQSRVRQVSSFADAPQKVDSVASASSNSFGGKFNSGRQTK